MITEQGEDEDELFLVLDGVVRMEVDGERWPSTGPGSMHGERAVLEGGTPHLDDPGRHACKLAVASATGGRGRPASTLEQLSSGRPPGEE